MLAFLGCTSSITALQVRGSIATPPSCSSRQATPPPPNVRDFFPADPRLLDIRRSNAGSMTGKGTKFSRAAIQLTQEQASAPAVGFRRYANPLGSNRAQAIH